jgi:hypothetical protein
LATLGEWLARRRDDAQTMLFEEFIMSACSWG